MEKSPSHHQNLAKDLNVTFKCLCDTVQNTSELLIQIPECLNRNGIISPEVASRYVLMWYTHCDNVTFHFLVNTRARCAM